MEKEIKKIQLKLSEQIKDEAVLLSKEINSDFYNTIMVLYLGIFVQMISLAKECGKKEKYYQYKYNILCNEILKIMNYKNNLSNIFFFILGGIFIYFVK